MPLHEAAAPPRAPNRVPGWLRPTVALLVVTALCLLLFRRLDGRQLVRVLAHADLRLVALALVINLTVNTWARAMRWKTLLEPLPRTGPAPGTIELSMLLFAGQAVSNLLPGRPGDAVRTLGPHIRNGYPVGGVVATQLVEKLIELTAFALLAIPVVLLSGPGLPLVIPHALWAVWAAVAVVALVLRRAAGSPSGVDGLRARILFVARRLSPTLGAALERFFGRLGEALGLMRAPRTWLRALGWSLLNDVTDSTMIGLSLAAVGVHASIGSWFLVLVAVNLAIAVPSTPGQVGMLEAAVVLALAAVHVQPLVALAGALLYHACHFVPITALGLFELLRLGTGFGRRTPATSSQPTRERALRL